MTTNLKSYSKREEKANSLTHAFGLLMAVAATVLLLHKALKVDNGRAVLAFSIYGFGMLVCMLSSTLYHYVQHPETKSFLRHFDHGSIYVLIAASFSPVTLILLQNEGLWGWGLFALVWFFALLGIALSFGKLKKNNHLKTLSYVLMGMSVFIAVKPILDVAVAKECVAVLYWIAAGGVFYIIGSVFYALAKREFIHTVFHVFVLLGMACHIVAAYLIPL
ncbi:MAG: hemolysin III family protein [Bacteroidales bacterium]|nr:hemolysin III family protein [Bacteroidales bacterium]MDD2559328.1 hemolysin III family protein [Bacteroidales bacterium]MDD4362223.1 hemolysin III family protein [Bacteroidales bacterium]